MFTEFVRQHFFSFFLLSYRCSTRTNAFLSCDTNCNEIITPVRNAVFSRNTSVNSHRGCSVLIRLALRQHLPAHLFFKAFPDYWSYYSAQWVVIFLYESCNCSENWSSFQWPNRYHTESFSPAICSNLAGRDQLQRRQSFHFHWHLVLEVSADPP